jgi:hypothetical protein
MGAIGFSNALRNARSQKIIDLINAGAGPGTMAFYTEPKPATGAAITTQVLLGTVTYSEPAGSVTDGVLTFSTITDDTNVDNDGVVAWTRTFDGDGNFVIDMSATDLNGIGPVKMRNLQVYAGGLLHPVAASLTEGNA